MTKDEFIATLLVMKFKRNTSHRYMNIETGVTLYAHSAITTINGISNFHNSYEAAITRLSEIDNV